MIVFLLCLIVFLMAPALWLLLAWWAFLILTAWIWIPLQLIHMLFNGGETFGDDWWMPS